MFIFFLGFALFLFALAFVMANQGSNLCNLLLVACGLMLIISGITIEHHHLIQGGLISMGASMAVSAMIYGLMRLSRR